MCKPIRGRPPTGKARQQKVDTRLSQTELERLSYCCERTGKTKSEVIREGIDTIYDELKIEEAAFSDQEANHFP